MAREATLEGMAGGKFPGRTRTFKDADIATGDPVAFSIRLAAKALRNGGARPFSWVWMRAGWWSSSEARPLKLRDFAFGNILSPRLTPR